MTSEVRTARWRRRFAFLFRGDRQVAFVAIELEDLTFTCRHRTVGLATGGDRNRNVDRVFNPDRKETHWGKQKLKRDQ
jgi:hypothetical protein